jgi:glutathionylspermidine synthase
VKIGQLSWRIKIPKKLKKAIKKPTFKIEGMKVQIFQNRGPKNWVLK